MINKKQFFAIGIILAFTFSFIILKYKGKQSLNDDFITIGIIQTASHPALDAAREGFVGELQERLHKKIRFITKNAEGSINNATIIAQNFHHDNNIDAIFAIGTPALQAMTAIEKQKPIFFAAVTNPRALGVIYPDTNVTGNTDMINVPDTIDILKKFIPSANTIGIIYNNAEVNSATIVTEMKKELEKIGLKFIDYGITNESELLTAVETAINNSDVLLAPTDNTVASAIDFIAQKALSAKKPLIVSDNLLVSKGALAARGIDYKTSGKKAAQRVISVLMQGKKPHELPLGYATTGRIFVNKKTLDALGLQIPQELKDSVTFVNGAQGA